jgi:hypothetical protein
LFDPVAAYGSLAVPVLAIGGSLDPIAPPAQHLENIEKIITAGGSTDVTVVTLEGANHLLQNAKTGLPNEYATLDSSFSEAASELISDWISARR